MQAIEEYKGDNFHIYNADCVEIASQLPDNSVHYSVFSPPFASLYTFSNSDNDMSNVKSVDEFADHFQFLCDQLFRVTTDNGLVSIHCCELPATLNTHGFIGLLEFPDVIRAAMKKSGFVYHSKVTIWKDPVIARARTNALGLLHKTIKENRAMVRQGIPDEVLTFRKQGEAKEKITGFLKYYVGDMSCNDFAKAKYHNAANKFIDYTRDDGTAIQKTDGTVEMSIDVWQHYASPVWHDIQQNDILEFKTGREEEDEKHLTPLQLTVIERCVQLWSKPGDVVFSPFLGIGSEGYVAVQMGRKFIGTELKSSYFQVAKKNLDKAELIEDQTELF